MSAVEATVDFDPDTLNLTSYKGRWVTCYIELPEGYDAGDILCDTVKLNGTVLCEKSDAGDYDKDGIPDIMVKFDRRRSQSCFSLRRLLQSRLTAWQAGCGLPARTQSR